MFSPLRCGLAATAFALLAGAAQAETHTLLTPVLPYSVAAHAAFAVGKPDPRQVLHLSIALPMRNQADMDRLLRDIYDPASPAYRRYLSVAAFTARFGPTAADYEAAAAYFAAAGFTVTGRSANRFILDVTADIATIERAFHVAMVLYRHPSENRAFFAPDREPTLDLGVPVLSVSGLDDFTLPTPRALRAARSDVPRTGSGPHGYFLGSDIRAAYYPAPKGRPALTGAGQSVGLFELGAYNPVDITTYFDRFGPPLTTKVVPISTDGTPATCSGKCRDGEQALDIEYAIAMAPGLARVRVYVGSTPESVLNRMASDNSSAQLSTSWGWHTNFAVDDPIFKEMAMQGQTNLTASGDYSSLKESGPWPEEDANIIAVGGTDLVAASPGGPRKDETGWRYSAGGPSLKKSIKIEPYQLPFINAANGGSTKLRNVPDIAGDANFNNYECYNLKCAGGWGGTSFASPIWAGFMALANEQAAKRGDGRIGFLNPILYPLAGGDRYHKILHDEIHHRSGLYAAVPGYDLVTGLGSPKGQELIDALAP